MRDLWPRAMCPRAALRVAAALLATETMPGIRNARTRTCAPHASRRGGEGGRRACTTCRTRCTQNCWRLCESTNGDLVCLLCETHARSQCACTRTWHWSWMMKAMPMRRPTNRQMLHARLMRALQLHHTYYDTFFAPLPHRWAPNPTRARRCRCSTALCAGRVVREKNIAACNSSPRQNVSLWANSESVCKHQIQPSADARCVCACVVGGCEYVHAESVQRINGFVNGMTTVCVRKVDYDANSM